MARLFQYRFAEGSVLGGHSFGNLFVLAMTGVTGSFEHALRETSRVLAVQGVILPSTPQDVQICAEFTDGTEECGESSIPEIGKPIERLRIKPEHPAAQPEAVRAILEADLVVLGPGSLYTSVVPNLLVEGIAKALLQSDAPDVQTIKTGECWKDYSRDRYDTAIFLSLVLGEKLMGEGKQGFQYIQEYTGFVSPGIFAMFFLGFFWKKTTSNAAVCNRRLCIFSLI